MIDLNKLELKEIIKGYKARFVHTENNTLAFWDIDEGAVMPAHSHPNEQSSQVMEGRFELTIGSETMIYEKGLVAIIPLELYIQVWQLLHVKFSMYFIL